LTSIFITLPSRLKTELETSLHKSKPSYSLTELLLKLTGNSNKIANIIDANKEEFSLFNVLFNQLSKIIPINKILLFPLPEFKLYYNGY